MFGSKKKRAAKLEAEKDAARKIMEEAGLDPNKKNREHMTASQQMGFGRWRVEVAGALRSRDVQRLGALISEGKVDLRAGQKAFAIGIRLLLLVLLLVYFV